MGSGVKHSPAMVPPRFGLTDGRNGPKGRAGQRHWAGL